MDEVQMLAKYYVKIQRHLLDKYWELKSSQLSWYVFAQLQCLYFTRSLFLDYSPLVQTTLLSSAGSFPVQSLHEALHIPLLPAQTLFIKQDQK